MKRNLTALLILLLLLSACNSAADPTAVPTVTSAGSNMTMGPGGGMMARHSAPIPDEYAGLSNPTAADEASLERGAEAYSTYCATCHGDGGMGDGPAATGLDPAPAAIAHTSQMLGDDYLFWRISEGGALAPFNSAMPAWSAALDEETRWDVINYIQALGSGAVAPRQAMGGAAYDAEAQAAQQAEMLAAAVADGVITQAEANTFAQVHAALEARMAGHGNGMMNGDGMMGGNGGNMSQMQAMMLAELVDAGTISQAQADVFNDVHDRLLAAGLMQ